MALSDLLLRLAAQAEDLETSAKSLHAVDEPKVRARAAELKESLTGIRTALGEQATTSAQSAAGRLSDLHSVVADRFDQLREEAVARVADSADAAQVAAQQAEQDAVNAVDFALHALQQAESLVLAAVDARTAADDIDMVENDVATVDLGETDADEAIGTGAIAILGAPSTDELGDAVAVVVSDEDSVTAVVVAPDDSSTPETQAERIETGEAVAAANSSK